MSKYLYEVLKDYADKKIYPFHMPGHKGRPEVFETIFPGLDTTELDETDDLYTASGALLRSMERAALVFGADHTFFLVNGSTAGMIAAILACVREGDEILAARNCHRSVYSGLIFSGAFPRYVYPEITPFGAAGGIDPADVEEALEKFPRVKAAVVTSPTYEGFTSDIKKIAEIAHAKNIPLIVDEAHGAHFKFHGDFPETALSLGADIAVQSLHKTLPALGQTALLHIRGDLVKKSDIGRTLPLVQTSSPSYLLMGLADMTIGQLESGGYDFDGYVGKLKTLRSELGGLKKFTLAGRELVNKYSIYDVDISKLMIILNYNAADVRTAGEAGLIKKMCAADAAGVYSKEETAGKIISDILAREYKIQVEMCADDYLLGITGVADTAEGLRSFGAAFKEIDEKISTRRKNKLKKPACGYITETVLSPRRAVNSKNFIKPIINCVGEISAEFIVESPPGIPLLVPGERITQEIMEYAAENGLKDMIAVVNE